MNRPLTRDEYLSQEAARERVAIGLILYKDLQVASGKDWIEAAQEAIQSAEILGVKAEYDNWLHQIPKMVPAE